MAKLITRTVKVTDGEYLAVNTTTKEVVTAHADFIGTPTEKEALEQLTEMLSSIPEIRPVSVTFGSVHKILYAMSEIDWLRYAHPVRIDGVKITNEEVEESDGAEG